MRLRSLIIVNPPKSKVAHLPSATEVTFAPMEALADGLGGLDTSIAKTTGEVGGGSYSYFANGDVLLAKVTPCFENGKKAIAHSLINGIGFATSEVHVIRPDVRRLHRAYLRYLLCSEDFRAAGMASMTGVAGLKRVSEDAVRNFRLPIISLKTQTAIADFLDRETARIDQLIEKKRQFVDLLDENEFALVSQLLTTGPASNVATKPAKVSWLDRIPAHWTWARMKDVCSQIIDCKNRTPPEVDEGRFFVVRTSCIRSARFNIEGGYQTDEVSFTEWTKRGRPQPGDVLFTREAPMGEACLAPEELDFCLGQRMMIYRPDPRKIDARFIVRTIYSAIGKSYIEAKGKGSTVGHLRVPEVYDFPCLLPPIDEQRAILAELDTRVGAYDALRAATRKSIETLREHRSALITAAVTGQIDVATWGKRGAADRRLDAIEADMARAAQSERQQVRA